MDLQNSDTITSGFLRQRRNLQVTSAILSIYYLAGAKISEVSFAGVGFSEAFLRPWVLVYLLWFALFYFLLRYAVYMKRSNGYQKFKRRVEDTEKALAPLVFKDFLRRKGVHGEVGVGRVHIDRNNLAFTFVLSRSIEVDNKQVSQYTLDDRKNLRRIRFMALKKVFFNDVELSEFLFPFLFAFFPLVAFLLINESVQEFLVNSFHYLESVYVSLLDRLPSKIELTSKE